MRSVARYVEMLLLMALCGLRALAADAPSTAVAAGIRPPVTALAFAADGRSLVVGSQAGIEIRSWPALEPIRRLETELGHVHDLAFSPDGRILAAAGGEPSERGAVESYRWPEGTLVATTAAHDDLVYAVAWRDDSRTFATASADRTIGIHDVGKDRPRLVLEGHSRAVLGVQFLPGKAGLVSGGVDESVRLWDEANGAALKTLPQHTRAVRGLALRPGQERGAVPLVASISDDRTVRFWQPTIGRLVRFARLDVVPTALAWMPDGALLVVAGKDGHLRRIDCDTAEVIDDVRAIDGAAFSLAIGRDGSAAVGGKDGLVRRVVFATPAR